MKEKQRNGDAKAEAMKNVFWCVASQSLNVEEIAEWTFQGQYISGVTKDAVGLVHWLKSSISIKNKIKTNKQNHNQSKIFLENQNLPLFSFNLIFLLL